jgi:hypothetical protein
MGCHIRRYIYGLKQAARQWYLKFDHTIRKFSFKNDLLVETKKFLYSNFDMKYMGEASYVLGIEIHRDR